MAVRVTATEVKAILDGCTLSDTVVEGFITTANTLINKIFSGDTECGETLLTEIEKWYSAHLIASTLHRMSSSERVGDASVSYTGVWGKNLEATPYGQVVNQLDITGKMANAGKMAASVKAITSFD